MQPEVPTLVVLDLDNTLYEYGRAHLAARRELIRYLSSELKLPTSRVGAALDVARLRVKDRLGDVASSHSRLLYVHEAYRHLGFRVEPKVILRSEQIYWSVFLGHMTLFDGVIDFLAALRRVGSRIVIVTDLTSQIQFRKIVRLGLEGWIDEVITSEFLGVDKDHPDGFKRVFSLLDISNESCVWFIGDESSDLPHSDDGLRLFRFQRGSRTSRHVLRFEAFKELEEFLG